MLKIKLARFGKTHQPHYRIVINEAKDKRDGKYVEKIGHYAPNQVPKILQVDVEKYDSWIKKGAQPTDTVRSLVERFKTGTSFPTRKPGLSKKAKAKAAAPVEEVVVPVAEVEAAPAETQPETEVAVTTDEAKKE